MSKNEEIKKVPFKNVNFLKHTKFFATLSIIIIVAGLITFIVKGFNLSIDYKSGSDITIETSEKVTKKDIEKAMKDLDLNLVSYNKSEDEIVVKVDNVLGAKKVEKVNDYFSNQYEDAKVNIGVVSNVVKKELTKNAIISVLFAILGIIIYISLRFKFSYAISSVIALIHDILIVFALFAIFRLEISVMFIAAILAIIGYSINDTIVSFDRIRENLSKEEKLTKERLREVCNQSIRETFMRTIYTSITTLLPIFALIFLGSRGILTFNLAMLFGLVTGTYSSIYIATVLFIVFESKNLNKKKKTKKVYKDDFEEKKIKGVNC